MKRNKIEVDFGTRGKRIGPDHREPWTPSHRRYGGCGVLTPSRYEGPSTFEVKGRHRGHERKFRVVRLERSPTGSGHGSFRVDEIVKDRIVTHGHTCSVPDFDSCLRVAGSIHN